MLRLFRQYPGTTLGVMAAVGAVKVGAILWETTFEAWPLSSVLVLPLLAGGFALGIGVGHDQLTSATGARRLGIAGGLVLSATAAWSLFGPAGSLAARAVGLLGGAALTGIPIGRTPPPLLAPLLGRKSSSVPS